MLKRDPGILRGNAREGYSFIEIMVAMVVLAIGLVGVAGITNVIIFQNRFSGDYIAASRLAYNKLDELMHFDTETVLRDVSSDFDCVIGATCSSVSLGLMLASTPGNPNVDLSSDSNSIKIKSDQTELSTAEEGKLETNNVCIGLPNSSKLESGTSSGSYCSRIEYDINAEGNFLPQNKGGDGKNSITYQPPYKYNRFYTVCRCIQGTAVGNADCTTTCSNFRNVDSNKVTFVARVYVYWHDSNGKFHMASTPAQGIEVEVEDASVWD